MVKVSVHKVTAKGHTYYYAWRGKGAPRLLSEPGTGAFVQELADALASRKTGDTAKLSGLCARYRASDDWKNLSDKTRTNWSPWLSRIQDRFGDLSLGQFDRPILRSEIRSWRDKWKKTPRTADVALQVFSRLLSFGVQEGRLTINVVTDIPRLYRSNRAEVIWTADDLAELEKFAAPEIMWAARLAALTGLRQGDLLRLSWSHVQPLCIEVRTSKTGRTATIPLHNDLKDLLASIPKRATTILTSTDKRPWKTGFGSSWGKAVKAAGIDKHFHDLRGTAATRLYAADLTIREIAGILAWSEDKVEGIIDRYVKRDEIMRDRIRRIENATRTEGVKPAVKPGGVADR